MNFSPTRLLAAAILAAVSALVVVLPLTPAGAADPPPEWQAVVVPQEGADDEPFEIDTSGGCPAPATNILGKVYGTGFPEEGTNVIGNTDAGVSQKGPFIAAVFTSLKMTMFNQDNPVPLEGTYRLVVSCRLPQYEKSHGDYVVDIRFTDPHHWVMAKPVTTKHGPTADAGTSDAPEAGGGGGSPGRSPSAGSAPGAGDTPDGSSAAPGQRGAKPSQRATQAPKDAPPSAAADARTSGGLTPTSWFLIGLGAVIGLGTVVLFVRRRPA